jgi:hypothetical protein
MKMRNIYTLMIAALMMTGSAAWAQKKSDEGKPNIWAATPMKIDGKISDWGDSLKIYNDGTRLWFNIANDAQNLYIAVKCNDSTELMRLVAGGISFSANAEGKKKAETIVTFPMIDRNAMRTQMQRPQGAPQQNGQRGGMNMQTMRKNLLAQMKEIRVEGFKDIVDGSISIYNTYGIKAAAAFNEKNQFICEIAVPLALMNLSANSTEPVSFNIKVNGLEMPVNQGGGPGFGGGDRGFSGGTPGGYSGARPGGVDMSRIFTSSEIWIKQTMAKQ